VRDRSSRWGGNGVVVRSILDWMGWDGGLLGVEVIGGVGGSEVASVIELPEC